MPSSPRLTRFFLIVFSLVLFGGSIPSLHAQAGQAPEEVEDRRPKVRSRALPNAGFRGLSPAEAQEAQDRYARARALEDDGRDSSALRAYKRVYKGFPRSTVAPEAYRRSAIIYVKQGKLTKAFDMIDIILRAYPNYGHFNELVSEEYRIAYEMIKGHRRRMLGILPGFSNRDKGIEYFERLIINAPYSDYAPLALMNIAEQHIISGRSDMAIDALDRLITVYPNSLVTADAYLRLAQVHEKLVDGPLYDQGSTRDSLDNYRDFQILFPRDPNVAEAEAGEARMKEMLAQSRLKIADFYYYKRSRYQAARVFYNEAITIAPTSGSATLARERLAQLEVEEAKAIARLAADTEGKKRGGFFGLFQGDATAAADAPGTGKVEGEAKEEERSDEQPSTTVTPSGSSR